MNIGRNDNWIEAQAKVVESRLCAVDLVGKSVRDSRSPAAYSDAIIRLTWVDQQNTVHSGEVTAPEDSPVFQLIEGESIAIKFNARNPDEFRIEGLSRAQAASAIKRIALAVVVFTVIILVWFGPDLVIAFSKK